MARRGTSPDGSKVERRKSQRFTVNIAIEASWRGADGLSVKEQAVAKQVNGNGGFLEMAEYPEMGSRITLTNFFSAEAIEARVLATPSSREGVSNGIIVELIVPNESFWGVNLQVKKTSIELQKLEKSLRSEGIDLRLLNEFRDAVDYVRTSALAVQQLRESQLHGRGDAHVMSELINQRIRRTTNICLELLADLDSGKVNRDAPGLDELYRALEKTHGGVKHLRVRDHDGSRDASRHESDRYLATGR